MKFDEKSPIETYEIIDLNSGRILDHFLLVRDFNNTTDTDQISSPWHISVILSLGFIYLPT